MRLSLLLKKRIDLSVGSALVLGLRPLAYFFGFFIRRSHDLTPHKKIHFIKMLGGGSLIIAAPSILGLRKKYPDLKFALVTTRAIKPFAEILNLFDEIEVIDDSQPLKLIWSSLGCLKRIFGADTVVDLEVYSRLSSVFMLLACARNRIGFYTESTFWRVGITTHLLFFNRSTGTYVFYDHMAKLLGAEPVSVEECKARLKFDQPNIFSGEEGNYYRIGIGHGCSELAQERMLDVPQWRKILTEAHSRLKPTIGSKNVEFVFFGVKGEQALGDQVIEALSKELPSAKFRNICGELSLSNSVGAVAQMDEFFAIDSALMHFARFLKVPLTSFWGPTDPSTRLREIPGLVEKAHYEKVVCSPCVHIVDIPPCHGNNICMKALFLENKRENTNEKGNGPDNCKDYDQEKNHLWLLES